MIKHLQLKNLKAWRDSGSVRLAPVTMLLGSNSSGKSTLLQSLLLLKQTAAAPDRTVHLNLGGDEANDLVSLGDFDAVLAHGTVAPRQFEIVLEFERPEGERVRQGRFACSYGQTASGAVVVQALSLSTVAREFRAVRRERGAYAVWVDGEPRPRDKGPHLAPERSIAFSAEAIALLGPDGAHLQDLSLALRRELEAIVYLGPLRQRPARDQVWNKGGSGSVGAEGQQAINALLSDALQPGAGQGAVLRSVSAGLQRMGLADRIEVRQLGRSSRYELLVHKDGVAANLRDVGVGVAQVLPVLTVAYSVPPGSTVLLEEPEIHLHPLAQAVLAELFADVQAFTQRVMTGSVQTKAQAAKAPAGGGGTGVGLDLLPWPKVDFTKFGPVERKDLSRIKKISGANLARNWVMIPHVTNNDEADITDLEVFRVSTNKENEKSGVKVTMLAFVIKAVVAALKKFPEFNTSLDGDTLVYKQYFHIGFAADTPNGLVVPVLRDADQKGILQISAEMAELAKKARDGKLGAADMQGGCFSISSLGGIGGTHFTPIINAPEVAILGLSKGQMKPVWDGKQFVPRLTLPLSLSYDHRVIDGASAARFNAYLGQLLADYRRILL